MEIFFIFKRGWCGLKGLCFLWMVKHSRCTQRQWKVGYRGAGMSYRIHKEKWTWLSQLQPFVLKCPSCVARSVEALMSKSQIGVTKVSFVFADSNDFSRHEFM